MKYLANGLTVLRVLLTAVLAVFLLAPSFAFDEGTTRIFCAVVFFVAALTDFLDGDIARGENVVSD
ncbi:MAG: CDP-alcohol phosphatidyltransferase family protein, partial [Clostridia bacterium]|nr:CDP-alcohol phosphatidyltransferase family protein [Clostridia bacterium]